MREDNVEKRNYQTFENLKQFSEDNVEFWSARDLQRVLDYSEYRHFRPVIERAKTACLKSGHDIADHFEDVLDMVALGSGAKRDIEDVHLSRYACYLIVQNGDSSKPVIANGQTYFAMQTRRQELSDDALFQQLKEDEKRLFLRNEMKVHNKILVEVAQLAGVESHLDFAIFQNHGYQGLYGGLNAKAIHRCKGLNKHQQILDNMGSTELAANLFRATQTEDKLRRENIKGKSNANKTHFDVGKKVRQTIEELGGTMPEDLPTPELDLKQIAKQVADQKERSIDRQKTPVKTPVKIPDAILSLLKENPEFTLALVAEHIGKSVSAIERAAKRLREQGKLRFVGPKKGGHWEVL